MDNPFGSAKILDHVDRIAEWKTQGWAHPIVLDLHMTNVCNHRCPGCNGMQELGLGASLTKEQSIKIVDALDLYGCRSVIFSGGGEPLANPDTVDVIEHAARFMSVGLITNGSLLSEDISRRLVAACKWIRVSLDAGSRETYELTHGVDSWDTTIRNLHYIAHLKRDCTIGVSYLTGRTGSGDMESATEYACTCGCDYIQFKPYRQGSLDYAPAIAELKCDYEKEGFIITHQAATYGQMNEPRIYNQCHGQHFVAVVTATGDMYRCCEMQIKSTEKPIGNILNQRIVDIWESAARLERIQQSCAACPAMCRNHALNTTLETLFCRPSKHNEFL